ncbi:MAG: glycosyltransferase family 4 protein [Candidatus Omnitrophota bacterium]
MNVLKVLFVCSGNGPAVLDREMGIAPFIRSQGESLRQQGIEVEFFPIRGRGIAHYLRHVFLLRRFLRKNRFDILHAHYGMCGWVAFLAFTRIPLVVSFMGDDLYGNADARGKKNGLDYVYIFFNTLLQYGVDAIVVKSENLAAHVVCKNKMQIIPNGVDGSVFKPMDRQDAARQLGRRAASKTKSILFLGNPANPRKNFNLLEKALVLMKKTKEARETRETSDDPGLELLTPFPVAPALVPLYLNLADVLVLTSYKEGSPNVIKEAMACNCPIVATDVGDVQAVIRGTEGCYLTSFEPTDVAEKIQLALAFGKRTDGRERIRRLEIGRTARRLIRIYKGLMPDNKGGF